MEKSQLKKIIDLNQRNQDIQTYIIEEGIKIENIKKKQKQKLICNLNYNNLKLLINQGLKTKRKIS